MSQRSKASEWRRVRRRWKSCSALAWATAAALLACTHIARADESSYPTKAIQLIVPFDRGSAGDEIARRFAQHLSQSLIKEVQIDSRSGAGAMLGTTLAARAKADGYTASIGSLTTHVLEPAMKTVRYDPLEDFDPVTDVAAVPYVIVVKPAGNVFSLRALVSTGKAGRRALGYSSASDPVGFIVAEALKSVSHTKQIVRVSPESASIGALAERVNVEVVVASAPALLEHIHRGAFRPLATSSVTRVRMLPDVPTVAESGYPGYDVVDWFALFVPRGTPVSIISRLHIELGRIATSPEMRSELEQLGIEPRSSISNIDVLRRIRADGKKYGGLLKAADARAAAR
jgi:tripartite-type tricarboxylate transporter receptor subunit TctC